MDSDERKAWTSGMVKLNTFGTVLGAAASWVAIIILIYLEFVR